MSRISPEGPYVGEGMFVETDASVGAAGLSSSPVGEERLWGTEKIFNKMKQRAPFRRR